MCRVKWFHLGAKRFADNEEVEMEVRKWLKQQPRDFYAVGFDTRVKLWGKVYQCCWRICREINVFSVSNITCFTFYIRL
jgi:hypothetical protein